MQRLSLDDLRPGPQPLGWSLSPDIAAAAHRRDLGLTRATYALLTNRRFVAEALAERSPAPRRKRSSAETTAGAR